MIHSVRGERAQFRHLENGVLSLFFPLCYCCIYNRQWSWIGTGNCLKMMLWHLQNTHTELSHDERASENCLILTIEREREKKNPDHRYCCLTLPPVVNNYQAWSIKTEQQERQKKKKKQKIRGEWEHSNKKSSRVEHFYKEWAKDRGVGKKGWW